MVAAEGTVIVIGPPIVLSTRILVSVGLIRYVDPDVIRVALMGTKLPKNPARAAVVTWKLFPVAALPGETMYMTSPPVRTLERIFWLVS